MEESKPRADAPPLQVWAWTEEEDAILLEHVRQHGTRKWKELVESGRLQHRSTKACCNRFRRLREVQMEGAMRSYGSWDISSSRSLTQMEPQDLEALIRHLSSDPAQRLAPSFNQQGGGVLPYLGRSGLGLAGSPSRASLPLLSGPVLPESGLHPLYRTGLSPGLPPTPPNPGPRSTSLLKALLDNPSHSAAPSDSATSQRLLRRQCQGFAVDSGQRRSFDSIATDRSSTLDQMRSLASAFQQIATEATASEKCTAQKPSSMGQLSSGALRSLSMGYSDPAAVRATSARQDRSEQCKPSCAITSLERLVAEAHAEAGLSGGFSMDPPFCGQAEKRGSAPGANSARTAPTNCLQPAALAPAEQQRQPSWDQGFEASTLQNEQARQSVIEQASEQALAVNAGNKRRADGSRLSPAGCPSGVPLAEQLSRLLWENGLEGGAQQPLGQGGVPEPETGVTGAALGSGDSGLTPLARRCQSLEVPVALDASPEQASTKLPQHSSAPISAELGKPMVHQLVAARLHPGTMDEVGETLPLASLHFDGQQMADHLDMLGGQYGNFMPPLGVLDSLSKGSHTAAATGAGCISYDALDGLLGAVPSADSSGSPDRKRKLEEDALISELEALTGLRPCFPLEGQQTPKANGAGLPGSQSVSPQGGHHSPVLSNEMLSGGNDAGPGNAVPADIFGAPDQPQPSFGDLKKSRCLGGSSSDGNPMGSPGALHSFIVCTIMGQRDLTPEQKLRALEELQGTVTSYGAQ